jgi:predicted MFS family arabinose efflux permease
VLLGATALFAAAPASRTWRPAEGIARTGGGALRSRGIRTLVIVLVAVGVLFGAVEVAITAAAEALDSTAAAGPLLGLWGAGSLVGGLVATRAGGGARTGAGLALLLAALAATHLALAVAAGSVIALAAVITAAGTLIAPTCATAYAMVDRAAPPGTVTEAFAWLATALAVGAALGAASAGAVAEMAGSTPTFVLASAAAAFAALVAGLRADTLSDSETPIATAGQPITVPAVA